MRGDEKEGFPNDVIGRSNGEVRSGWEMKGSIMVFVLQGLAIRGFPKEITPTKNKLKVDPDMDQVLILEALEGRLKSDHAG